MKTKILLTLAFLTCLVVSVWALTTTDKVSSDLRLYRATNDAWIAEARANFGELYRNDLVMVNVLTQHIVHPIPVVVTNEYKPDAIRETTVPPKTKKR